MENLTITQVEQKLTKIRAKLAQINYDENGNPIGDRSYAYGLSDEKELWEDRLFTLQCRNREKLTVNNIDEAIKSNFWEDATSLKIVESASDAGYIIRLSHTQAQWTDEGLAKARIELSTLKIA